MKKLYCILACALMAAFDSQAATITLNLIDSYAKSAPFGLAFDGTNIYWSQSNRQIRQMTTNGVDTGVSWTGPVWSELAFDVVNSKIVQAQNQTIYYQNVGGGAVTTQVLSSVMTGGTSLQDGLDVDNGEIWISPDVGNVYRFSQALGTFVGPNPFLGGSGGYSGVERVDVAGNTYIIVVNDAVNPRRLCVHDLNAALIGCQSFANARYEGLAFDGRYLWAADFQGNKIDKYDVLSDGGSIFVPPSGVPEPSTYMSISLGLLGLACAKFRKRT